MNIRTLSASAIALGTMLVAFTASAATLTLSPATATVTAGQSVNLAVVIDPQGSNVVTAKAVLAYPTDLLSPQTFSFAPTWIPLSQTGYDQMSGGMVIKTGGYPGGFTTTKTLGTLTVRALKAGTITITSSGSILYDGNSSKLPLTTGSAVITSNASAPAPAPASAPKPVAKTTSKVVATTTATTTVSTPVEVAVAPAPAVTPAPALTDAVGDIGGSSSLIWIIVIILLIAAVVLIYIKIRKQ